MRAQHWPGHQMLRSAVSRPTAIRWRQLNSHFRTVTRRAAPPEPRPWTKRATPPKIETPETETPKDETPKTETPQKETPKDDRSGFHGPSKPAFNYRERLQLFAHTTLAFIAVFLFLHIETTYFYAFDLTHGISMLPTMNATGDGVIISKLYRRGKNVQVGDVVSFDHPADQGVQSIKRVVGLEGDWVCRDTPGVGRGTVIQVPKGHCWVVGDNLAWSRDSRLFGPLPMALIKGKVLARYKLWSTDFELLENGLKPAVEDDID